ncbi:MAG: hypothetical protein KA293_01530 [Bacteroidia bacterium]|nr:hypothetical protein [Bacteroidia bacterium]
MKAPDQPHFIQRFKFDFEIESKEDAHRLHTDLSRIFNSSIKGMLDEIMTDLDDPGHVIRIPQLVIDLGEIYEGSLEKEVLMRFETAFRRELAMRVGELRHGRAAISADKGERIPVVPARMEIVTFFLVNGRLPAGAEQMAGKLESLMLELLEANPANILRMLKMIARKAGAIKRLSMSFSEKLIGKIYAAIVSENALSVAAIEKKLIADTSKVVKAPNSVVTMEVRQAIFRFLLIEPPAIFDRKKFQAAVSQEIRTVFGVDASEKLGDVEAQQEAFSSQNEQRERRQAALEVVERFMKGSMPVDSPLALAEAWEFLLQYDAQALRKFLAKKRVSTAAIANLVKALSPAAMRDFVQKVVPASPMQLIHVAASIASAFALQRKGSSAEKQLAAEVYAVLIQQLALNPSVTPSATQIAEAIKAHLAKLPDAPKQLLKDWNKLDLPGVTTPESRKREKAAKEATDAAAQKEFEEQVAALKARTKSTSQEDSEPGQDAEDAETSIQKGKAGKSSKKGKVDAGDASAEAGEEFGSTEDDEAFFKRYRQQLSERAAGFEFEDLPGVEEAELIPSLNTPEGRVELFLHVLVHGTRPWWAEPVSAVQLELYLKTAITNSPQAVKTAFARLVRSMPASGYEQVITRLISSINETTLNNLLMVLAPEIGGFVTTISMALETFWESAQETYALPGHLANRFQFVWHPPLKYVFQYMTSGFSPGQMLRFVMKDLADALGISSRVMIAQMTTIGEEAVAKGEKRFNAFKAMVPKSFEGLQVAPPTPHEPIAEPWALLEILEQAALNRGIAPEPKTEEKTAVADTLSPEERFLLDRLKQAQKRPAEDEQQPLVEEVVEGVAADSKIEVPFLEETETGKVEVQPPLTTEEIQRQELEAAKERELSKDKEQVSGLPLEAPVAKQEPVRRKTNLTPEEEEAEATVVLEVIKQYLEHGTMSAAATEYFTPATFRSLVLGTLSFGTKPLTQLLRGSMAKSGARLRVIAMGDEVALRVIGLLQSLIASKMQPFIKELVQLFASSSAPVSRVHVFDHAMRYAIQSSGSTFVPLHYVRDFVEYVTTLPGRNVREVLLYANKRLESSSSPLKETLAEMLDVVERIEQTTSQGSRKQVSTASAPVLIKAPDGDIYVTNAGAGIIHIIFAQLFQAFHLLTADKMAFVSRAAASRAAHYIQYLTDKELDAPEEKMVFNKLLVGLPLEQPLEPLEEPLNQDEIDTCEYVMQTLCEKWTVMKTAGPDYLRKTFLMREGRLRSNGDGWIIRVEQTGLDILKNKIPWATNPIRLPWLTYLIDVDWP